MRRVLLLACFAAPLWAGTPTHAEALAKGRARLEKLATEGDPRVPVTPESLLEQAKASALSAEQARKAADKLKHQGRTPAVLKQIEQLRAQADQAEKMAADLRAQAAKLRKNPPPPWVPRADVLAPLDHFDFQEGEQALIGLALVQSGARPSDPLPAQIWESIRTGARKKGMHQTYTLGVSLMFAEAMMHSPSGEGWPPPDKKEDVEGWMRACAETLAELADGGAWTYQSPYGVGEAPRRYTVGADEIGSDALKKSATPAKASDLSNTQYAVLGLKAASLCGIRLKDTDGFWRRVLQWALLFQDSDGKAVTLRCDPDPEGSCVDTRRPKVRARGWSYGFEPKMPAIKDASASMTAAGLTVLLVARSELELSERERALVDEGVHDGVAWFQEHWAVQPDGYLLYGLERLGVLGGIRSLGGHDWFEEGARALVGVQKPDGSWVGMNACVGTSFGVLFLSRGTSKAYARALTK